jgi:acyl-CoA reductase-like NAD-dependent aldehyde dehydrogenase
MMIVDTIDDAISLANDTEYGLSASVFSRNIAKAIRCARRIETGACHINAMTIHDEPYLPHGGSKKADLADSMVIGAWMSFCRVRQSQFWTRRRVEISHVGGSANSAVQSVDLI